jgi:cellulose synthase/poly-beta-1,6-N-acetylglucosamine synthase-like glycosyltransferase
MESLLKQTYKDFTWVIVNHNGDTEYFNKTASMASEQWINTVVIHRTQSISIAAAANNGIAE